MKLAFFICSPPGFTSWVNNRRNMTSAHPVLNCQAFKCDHFDQWQEIGKREVAASGRKLWMAVLFEHDDGTFSKPYAGTVFDVISTSPAPETETELYQSQDGQVVKSLGSYPEAEGAIPSPATNVADEAAIETVSIEENDAAQPEPAAATLNERIVAQIATKPLRIKDLSEALGVPAAELKAEIEASANLTLSGPGWVKLAE